VVDDAVESDVCEVFEVVESLEEVVDVRKSSVVNVVLRLVQQ
jgi:hypothetical protein